MKECCLAIGTLKNCILLDFWVQKSLSKSRSYHIIITYRFSSSLCLPQRRAGSISTKTIILSVKNHPIWHMISGSTTFLNSGVLRIGKCGFNAALKWLLTQHYGHTDMFKYLTGFIYNQHLLVVSVDQSYPRSGYYRHPYSGTGNHKHMALKVLHAPGACTTC